MPSVMARIASFNTQPPEGGCRTERQAADYDAVSTHSRLKAAASQLGYARHGDIVSTHSRLKAAARPHTLWRWHRAFQHTAA